MDWNQHETLEALCDLAPWGLEDPEGTEEAVCTLIMGLLVELQESKDMGAASTSLRCTSRTIVKVVRKSKHPNFLTGCYSD